MALVSDTLQDLDRRARRWIAVEELLFTTLGRWARELADPAAQRTFGTWCHRHAWHAELWRARLPAVGVGSAEGADDSWVSSLRGSVDSVSSAADAIRVLRETVLPALEDAVAEHRDAIDPLLDGPSARVLDLVAADLAAEAADLAHWSVSG
jgi:hypothetical protein